MIMTFFPFNMTNKVISIDQKIRNVSQTTDTRRLNLKFFELDIKA